MKRVTEIEKLAERNEGIIRSRAEGMTLRAIAAKYGLSLTRVAALIKKEDLRLEMAEIRQETRALPKDLSRLPAERIYMMHDALSAIHGTRADLLALAREWRIPGELFQQGDLVKAIAKIALNKPVEASAPPPPPEKEPEDII